MLDHTDPVASIIPATSLDAPSDNAMTALSRLALGPVNTDYYLAVFERFDSTGRTTTTWNWAACLATLNWMVFRQLWSTALVYVAAAEGLALVMLAIGRTFLHWPLGVEVGVLGAVAVLAFAVPGLYGNAMLYADIRKRVARALAASRTLPEACALLQKQASTRRRLHMLVLANVALVAAAALAYGLWPSPSSPSASAPETRPLSLEPAVTVAQATAAAAAAASTPRLGASASGLVTSQTDAPDPAVATASEPASAPAAAVSSAAASAATTAVMASAKVPASAPPAAPTTATPTAPATKVQAATPPTRTQAAPAGTAPAPAPAATPPERSAKAAAPTKKESASRPPTAKAAKTPASATASAASAASATASAAAVLGAGPVVGTAPGYYINVGLFADEANARKAQARLLNEGLPAFRQELNSAKGRRIRVRVGPYETRARADAAAASIRAMALEAVVFKQ